ncbi:MAG: hypothetical protein NTX44_05770 [Ignavibacteriales bacterium]|nr:hypothetical protein [Ignavibacteriales bacterium]
MTILEATVEITKAAIGSAGGASTATSNATLLTTVPYRKEFLDGISALYKKLLDLESGALNA